MQVSFQRNEDGVEQWSVTVAGTSPEDCAARLMGQLKREVLSAGVSEEESIREFWDSGEHVEPMMYRKEIGYTPKFDLTESRYNPNSKDGVGKITVVRAPDSQIKDEVRPRARRRFKSRPKRK